MKNEDLCSVSISSWLVYQNCVMIKTTKISWNMNSVCAYIFSVIWDQSFWGNSVQWGNLKFQTSSYSNISYLYITIFSAQQFIPPVSWSTKKAKYYLQGLFLCDTQNHCAKTPPWHCLLFASQWGGPKTFSNSVDIKTGKWWWRSGAPLLRFPCAVNLATAPGSFPQRLRHEAGEPDRILPKLTVNL